jgi:hypothetical protein
MAWLSSIISSRDPTLIGVLRRSLTLEWSSSALSSRGAKTLLRCDELLPHEGVVLDVVQLIASYE